jgi:1,2-diacylglycerol 3-beta-galactosyltransferase
MTGRPPDRHDGIMPEIQHGGVATPLPLLFLISDTGGGHRNAARAVGQALDRMYPGRFAPVLCDPLGGPGSARLLRWVTGLYGPAIRLTPWLWGAAYYVSNSRPAVGLLRRTLLRLADRPTAEAARACRPAAIVSFHPLTGTAAVAARERSAPGIPVVTVVTDLARTHAAWRYADVDLIIAPPAAGRGRGRPRRRAGGGAPAPRDGWAAAGLPVTREYWGGGLRSDERVPLRRSLGLSEKEFLVLLTGGGEGSGGLARRAAAILRWFADVDVVAVCGRNARLRRRLDRLAARSRGRLTVTGFTGNMADLLRCCDLVVTKAGPGTIAEAACCGAPMLLTSHVPGQESGNTELVAEAAAGRSLPGVRRLVAEIGRLREDQGALDAMRAASARMSRPGAAADIAALIAGLVGAEPTSAASPARPARPARPGRRQVCAESAAGTTLSAHGPPGSDQPGATARPTRGHGQADGRHGQDQPGAAARPADAPGRARS